MMRVRRPDELNIRTQGGWFLPKPGVYYRELSPPIVGYDPHFNAEANSWCWFEPVEGQEFESGSELRATLPKVVYHALTGHLPHDPTRRSMKEYPSEQSALLAYARAMSDYQDRYVFTCTCCPSQGFPGPSRPTGELRRSGAWSSVMSQEETPRQPRHVKFLFIRTSRPVAVAVCYLLVLAAAVCVVLAAEFVNAQNEKWLWLLGFILAVVAGHSMRAIYRSDREARGIA
jgi:hypothetical protein